MIVVALVTGEVRVSVSEALAWPELPSVTVTSLIRATMGCGGAVRKNSSSVLNSNESTDVVPPRLTMPVLPSATEALYM